MRTAIDRKSVGRGRCGWGLAVVVFALVDTLVAPPVLGHEDAGEVKITDFAAVTEVWTDQEYEDGFIFSQDAELCVIAIFQHPNHDRYSMKITTKVGDQTVETVVPYFDVVEKCNDDVEMDGDEKYFDPQTMQWRLVGGPSNGITNVLQGSRHDECSLRAPWTINVQGYSHNDDAADILKKIAKALRDASGLLPDEKWNLASKAGAALAEFIASLFHNVKIGEVTLDFPPTDDGPKTASGAHLTGVTAQVMQESREAGAPCQTPSSTSTSTPTATVPEPTPTETQTAEPTSPSPEATPTATDTVQATPTNAETPTATPMTTGTVVPTTGLSASSLAAPAPPAAEAVLHCGADAAHPFAKRLTRAARSWQELEEAAALLPMVGTTSGEDTPDPDFVRLVLAKAIGNIGSIVATAEVEEATGNVDAGVLAQAQALVAEGDDLRDQAVPTGDATLLLQALARYRAATEMLLPLLHPACQTVPETRCQRAIARASAAYAQAKLQILTNCEIRKVKGKLAAGTDCHAEPKTAMKLAQAAAGLRTALDKACGGADKTCGADAPGEAPSSLGFDATCPDLTPVRCDEVLTDCGNVATCLACVDEAAVDRLVALAFGALVPTDPKNKAEKRLNKCQRKIGAAAEAFFAAKSDALRRCWNARAKGKHANACPSPGDGKAAGAIAQAAAKLEEAICKACGGEDKTCGGDDDFAPAAIGFATDCDDVRVPDGTRCAAPVETLQDLVTCVECVAEFTADCADAAQVPDFVTYPSECRP